MVVKNEDAYTYLVSPDFDPTVVPEGYIWDETAFQELVKATDKATADETIYTYGGPQGGADVDYLNAADLTISDQKYNGEEGEVVGTTVTANAFNNTGTVTTDGAIADTGAVCCNRNGRYRVFEARGAKSLAVRVSIEASKTNNK